MIRQIMQRGNTHQLRHDGQRHDRSTDPLMHCRPMGYPCGPHPTAKRNPTHQPKQRWRGYHRGVRA